MLNKFYNFLEKNSVRIIIILLFVAAGGTIYNLVDVVRKPPELKDYKGGVQNHLVWDVKGKCYFVRPSDDKVNYLIYIPDCDKVN